MRDMEKKRRNDRDRVRRMSTIATAQEDPAVAQLRAEVKALRRSNVVLQRVVAEEEKARAERERLSHGLADAETPEWLLAPSGPPRKGPGVPTIFFSDWHGGEDVDPAQVGGRNFYNPREFTRRVKRTVQSVLDLSFNHMVLPAGWKYPGIVVPLGGDMLDMLNGRIHTSEGGNPVGPRDAMALVSSALVEALATFADHFGRVFCPCVVGNHGRLSMKMPARDPAASNMDAILYDIVRNHRKLAGKDVRFAVAPGVDIRYQVLGHAYVLTHGDAWRGGDGEVGALGPVTRGVGRLRRKYLQMSLPVDTVILGHFHQYVQGPGYIINGSLKGYDEYAYKNSFPFEPPTQAFWFTHAQRGRTCMWPVYANVKGEKKSTTWAEVDALYTE